MRFFIIIFFSVLIFAVKLTAQTFNFTNYSVSDGVDQSDILSVSQAKNGYLLFGTNGGGLGIFDGYYFKTIKEKHGLSNNVVFSVDVSDNGDVWVATREGISRINSNLTKVEKNYQSEVSFYSIHVNKRNKDVLFGSSQGIYKYSFANDSVVFVQTEDKILNSSFTNCIYTDVQNNIWIGTKSAGLFRIDEKGKVKRYYEQNGLTVSYVKTIIEGKLGEYFVGTIDGLFTIKKDSVFAFDLPKNDGSHLTFTSSVQYKNQLVFGALNSQLYFIDKSTYKPSWISPANGFTYKKIWSVFTDDESNLWLGTIGAGLVKFNPIFTYYNSKNGLSSDYINSIYESSDDNIYVGLNGGYNVIDKNNNIEVYQILEEIGFSNAYHFTEYNNQLYIGTNNGIFKKNGKNTVRIPFSDPTIVDENIYCSKKYRGKVYFGGKTGLFLFESDTLKPIKNSPKEFVYDLEVYRGALFLASNKGVYKYNGKDFEFFSKENGLECDRAKCLGVDIKNNLWIGTSEGAFMYNGKNFKKIDETNGLTSENIYLIEIDEKNNIWLGTNKGLDRLNLESVYQHFNNPSNKIEIRNYTKNEGFNGVECNLNASFKNRNNKMYFGTINGLYLYHIENDIINQIPPKVTLKNIKLNFADVDWKKYSKTINSETDLPDNLNLLYNNNNLIFEFVGVSLKNPTEVYYQYMLEGLDEQWLPLTKDRKAVYTAIPHGDYTFRLRAVNSDGVWNDVETKYSFSISPPWYKTTWFYTAAILLVLLAGYVIIIVRTRNLKKIQIQLETKVDERTKELREEKEKVESVNSTLAKQKRVIEIANKNITDSINYAKKIQDAILPRQIKLEELNESVSILYLPKDVVSGDFYWFEKINNLYIFVTADCTGHGVPGAFMSMIGVNNLNQIILENKIYKPNKILKELNIAVKKVLKQEVEGSESRDGMDISIACFDTEKRIVSYSGAFRPLIYIRNNELIEIKGSRNPIGGSAPTDFEYELHELNYYPNDMFYMFSDGYPDQFGGNNGKKFMNKQLKEVFLSIHKKSPQTQRGILKEILESWRGENEQIDDVLVMCVKV